MSDKKWINNKSEVPNGGWRFTDPDTKTTIRAASWGELLAATKAHRKANALPIGLQWDEFVENSLAAQLPVSQVTTEDPKPRNVAVPRDEWPMWAKTIAVAADRPDAGVGDTAARTIGHFGGEAFKSFYHSVFGRSCNCHIRQANWNALYPYHWEESKG